MATASSDIDITRRIAFHRHHGRKATVDRVRPPARFGAHGARRQNTVTAFEEKPQVDSGLINGGFFVLDPWCSTRSRATAPPGSANPWSAWRAAGELMAWHTTGFWQPMDTLRDKQTLVSLWESGRAPWALWRD